MGNDLNLALALLLNNDVVAEVVGAALNLDGVLEELLKGRDVEDLVSGGLLGVDDELPLLSILTCLIRARVRETYLLGLLLGLARLLL